MNAPKITFFEGNNANITKDRKKYVLKLFIRYKFLKLNESKLLGKKEITIGVNVSQVHFMLKH